MIKNLNPLLEISSDYAVDVIQKTLPARKKKLLFPSDLKKKAKKYKNKNDDYYISYDVASKMVTPRDKKNYEDDLAYYGGMLDLPKKVLRNPKDQSENEKIKKFLAKKAVSALNRDKIINQFERDLLANNLRRARRISRES